MTSSNGAISGICWSWSPTIVSMLSFMIVSVPATTSNSSAAWRCEAEISCAAAEVETSRQASTSSRAVMGGGGDGPPR